MSCTCGHSFIEFVHKLRLFKSAAQTENMGRGRFEGSILTFVCMKWRNYDLQRWGRWELQPALRERKTGEDGEWRMVLLHDKKNEETTLLTKLL
jgi:hypothetical protein